MVKNKNLDKVDNTYAEAFSGMFCRALVTADDEETLTRAAYDATSTPGAVIGRVEGGIESWVSPEHTPDGRKGAILQF